MERDFGSVLKSGGCLHKWLSCDNGSLLELQFFHVIEGEDYRGSYICLFRSGAGENGRSCCSSVITRCTKFSVIWDGENLYSDSGKMGDDHVQCFCMSTQNGDRCLGG